MSIISNCFEGIEEEIEEARRQGRPSERENSKDIVASCFEGCEEEIEEMRRKYPNGIWTVE